MIDNTAPKRTILIVDDHPINVDSYKTLLSGIDSNANADFLLAYDSKEAYQIINGVKAKPDLIDFAFIDINLPPYEEKKIYSGSDLALLIKDLFPLCKIIIISMHKEPLWVNQIYKSVNPQGFIAKSDIDYKSFPQIFENIEKNETYYSTSIKESRRILIQKNINWDDNDSKILQCLAEGIKTIQLPHFVPLSLSAIEKRKANIKKQLLLHSGSDKEMIDVAKKLGLL